MLNIIWGSHFRILFGKNVQFNISSKVMNLGLPLMMFMREGSKEGSWL
jgi:hypothetical protein